MSKTNSDPKNSNPYRADFPLLRNNAIAYLDNAATTQKPQVVLDAMNAYYTQYNANVHRGLYTLAEHATESYEHSRDVVQQFINAQAREEIVFTSGTTASLNLLAYSLGEELIHSGDSILVSPTEHHSNIVPWQMLAKRKQAEVKWLPLLADGTIDSTNIESVFNDTVKIVSIGHISNASGQINPIQKIISLAHARNIPVIVDAAQSVPHQFIDVQDLDCDFLAFSAHKLGGPTGTGVLYGKRKWLDQLEPWQGGGDMIATVTTSGSTWAELPHKFEAGTPNIAGVIGLGAAIEYLKTIGMDQVQKTIQSVYEYLFEQLNSMSGVQVMGTPDITQRSSIVSFTVDGMHPHDLAQIADTHNVAIRAGHHCAQPLMNHWNVPATARASVYIYSNRADVDALCVAIQDAQRIFSNSAKL